MKVRDLIEHLKKLDADDVDVFVSVKNCLSAYAAEPVTDVHLGFDWTAGKVLLFTKQELHRLQKCCRSCVLCKSRVGERIGTSLFREKDKTISLCVRVDGKHKARIPIKPIQEGGAR